MSEVKLYPVSNEWAGRGYIDTEKYRTMYRESIENPDKFWTEQAKRIDWFTPYTKVKNTSFALPDVTIKWFEDGVTQHLATIASTATSRSAASRRRSSGRAMTPITTRRSATASFTTMCAGSPTC